MEILLGLPLSVIAGLIPAMIYGWFVNWLDRHEKEPWWLLMLTFLWGAIPAIIMALIAQVILGIPTTWVVGNTSLAYEVIEGSVWAPLTEEVAKGLGVVIILLLAQPEFDNVLDGIVYGAMTGLGFAFTENIFYFVGGLAESGWGGWVLVVLLRTVLFGLNHAFFSGVFGASLGWANMTRSPLVKLVAPAGGLVAAITFHGLHNLGASLAGENCLTICISFVTDWGGILLLGVLIGLIWQQERRWMAEQLPGEITDEVYQLITSWRHWYSLRGETLLRGDVAGWRRLGHLRHAGAELAFKKHQLTSFGANPEREAAIERYRLRLAELGVVPPPAG